MSAVDPDKPPTFEEDNPAGLPTEAFELALEGYEGPIDVLLQLARDQKVDITKISILALADQYLAFIAQARELRIEIAADYLVMAAWLAYLKSRLLIPEPETVDGEPSGAEMAAALAFQLQRLQAMRDAGQAIVTRPRLGIDVFARGEPQQVTVVQTNVYAVTLFDLLKAYGAIKQREQRPILRIMAMELYSVEDAIQRLGRMLGELPGWCNLASLLPADLSGDSLKFRSAVASTFAASLEMVRQGKARLRQDGTFGPIFLQGVREIS